MAKGSTPSGSLELEVRKGSPSVALTRDEFRDRFRARFADPAFEPLATQLDQLEDVAWSAYGASRKSPRTRVAGPGYADPSYSLSLDWRESHHAIRRAQELHDLAAQARVLVIAGGARSDRTCPGEQSKTQRLVEEACDELRRAGCHVDLLDLSRLTAEYGAMIYPCKGCVSTATRLCHWPRSCYPNHGLGQSGDMMADIHGDTAGVEALCQSLHDWLCDMALDPAGPAAELDRYIGYYGPYATSHDALDDHTDIVTETRNVARVLPVRVAQLRAGAVPASADVRSPRPK